MHQERIWRSHQFIAAFCVITTILNGFIFHLAKDTRTRTFRDVVQLPRPNAFVGLERFNDKWNPNELPEHKKIYPNLLSIVNSSNPDRAYGDDPEEIAEWVKSGGLGGLIAPEDRVFKIDLKVSTIVEFIATDYKMENCELFISIPAYKDLSLNSSLAFNPSSHSSAMGPIEVDLWQLGVKVPLDQKTLSWRTRPERLGKLDAISLRYGMEYSYAFECPMNSIWAFELSLTQPGVENDTGGVEWKQDHADPNPSIVMLQHASDNAILPKRPKSQFTSNIEFGWSRLVDYLSLPLLAIYPPYKTSPSNWPLPIQLPFVAQRIIGSSPHFGWQASGWTQQYPQGGHTIHLLEKDGSGISTRTVALFHQLRCLEILRGVYMGVEGEKMVKEYKKFIRERDSRYSSSPSFNSTSLNSESDLDIDLSKLTSHCVNYLRQTLLCTMDLRFEAEGSVFTQNGMDTMCYDWQVIYDEAQKNWESFR